ncbi:MAG: hypothetical protein J1F61_04840 [Clostridiales bacterium]|nr:hypothetical protein [Clostridiales bacterium]
MAIAGLILSILGIVGIGGFFVPFMGIATFICSLVGLILGAMAMKKGKSGIATAALVIGIIGVVLNVPSVICGICVYVAASEIVNQVTAVATLLVI